MSCFNLKNLINHSSRGQKKSRSRNPTFEMKKREFSVVNLFRKVNIDTQLPLVVCFTPSKV